MDNLFKDVDKKYRKENLQRFLSLTLDEKIEWAKGRIREFFNQYPNATISFSGGKDSSVLLHLVRSIKPDAIAVFSDTGVEYNDIYNIVKNTKNVIWKTPIKNQQRVWKEDGYPIFSKAISLKVNRILYSKKRKTIGGAMELYTRKGSIYKIPAKAIPFLDKNIWYYEISDKCCHYLKEATCGSDVCLTEPSFVGTRVMESKNRLNVWLAQGCNIYDPKSAKSQPIAIWTEEDIDNYAIKYNVPIADCYILKGGKMQRTGCKTCPFGVKFEEYALGYNRFETLKELEPQSYNKIMENKIFKYSLQLQGIRIRNDSQYMEEYYFVERQLKSWWNNYEKNIEEIINQYNNRQVKDLTKKEFDLIRANLLAYKKVR